ncbi:MAG: hypothetical protein ACRDNG_12560 [Gaiellaceae bacterium]
MSDSDDLRGDALLDKLVKDGTAGILEPMWRAGEPGLASRLVGRFANSTDARLGDLLAEEVLRPRLGDPFAGELLAALSERRPKLSQSTSRELSDAFRDEQLPPTYQNHSAIGMWVLEQPGSAGDTLTLEVLTGESPLASDEVVRASAVQRCRSRRTLLRSAGAHFLATLEDPVEAGEWEQAAEFVEYACRNESEVPPSVRPIVDRLIETAPETATVSEFGDGLAHAAARTGLPVLKKALTTRELPSTSGSQALAALVDEVPIRRERASLFARLLEHQPHLWSLAAAPEWDDEEWKARLTAAAASKKSIDCRVLEQLFTWSPVTVSPLVTRIAVTQATADNDHILDLASSNLDQVLEALPDGDTGVSSLWWPKETRRQEYLRGILSRSLQDDDHGALIAAAYGSRTSRSRRPGAGLRTSR